ncbi:hypothetical protein Efla_000601 [Eimeria flavescens]
MAYNSYPGWPTWAPAADGQQHHVPARAAAGDAHFRTQQHPQQNHLTDSHHPSFQSQKQGRGPHLGIPPKVRTVGWHTADDEDAAIHAAEAKIEVAVQCRPKEDVLHAIKNALRIHPKLSPKHRDVLGNTVKGLIADRRMSYYLVSGMRAVMAAAAEAWTVANKQGVASAVSTAAASVAAELTILGVSPKEAGQKAAETAVSKGVGAVKNLVMQHKVEQQRHQDAAAAAAALRPTQEAEDEEDSSSDEEASKPAKSLVEEDVKPARAIAPDSAAAASHGVHIPQQLIDTATSESFLRYAEYFDKRLESFLSMLINEMRNLATNTWRLVEERLLEAADTKEAKVFYLQLSADAVRYASQMVLDSAEAERLKRQSLQIYQNALGLLDQASAEEKDEVLLSSRLGLVLNYTVLLHDAPDGAQKAVEILAAEFRRAVENVVQITDADESRRVMMVMRLLRGNVEAWCQELGRTDATALLGLDMSAPNF